MEIFKHFIGVELIDWIPTTMQEDLYNFNEEHIIAMETGSPDMTNRFHTWFNGEAYHSLASAVLYTDRTLIQKFFSESTVELQDNISISARNSPLPATLAQSLEKNTSFTIQGNIISFNLVIGLMIMFSAFSMLPVRERETGVKTMQRCSGVPQSISWAAEYLWDYINSIPPLLITCLVFVAFQSIDGIKVEWELRSYASSVITDYYKILYFVFPLLIDCSRIVCFGYPV